MRLNYFNPVRGINYYKNRILTNTLTTVSEVLNNLKKEG